jgi:hypothetical protein
MAQEARGANRQAADCRRKMLDSICHHPDRHDTSMVEQFG